MSKRLVRLNAKIIFLKLGHISGLEINVVLQNGLTYLGKIKSVTIDYITVTDARGHLHKIAISDVYEVIYDMEDIKTFDAAVI